MVRLLRAVVLVIGVATSAQALDLDRARPVPLERDPVRVHFPTTLGRAVLDSFVLYGGPGSGEGTFETPLGDPDRQGWTGVDLTDDNTSWAVGDFSKVLGDLDDLDPCASNTTPQMTFIDDGTEPANRPGQSTGGATSTVWSYGTVGGYVVNGDGGVGFGNRELYNEVWSPEIALDDPSPADDGIGGGLTLAYSVWSHLPRDNGIFHVWSIRSSVDASGSNWGAWRDRDLLHYSEVPRYVRRELEVGDLLVPDAKRVQIALGVIDLSDALGLPGLDSTPSPWFDDVVVTKHDVAGPSIVVDRIDEFHDGFAQSGIAFDGTNYAQQAIRFDTGRDINPNGTNVVPGDSMVVRVVPVVPGTSLDGAPVMTWFLRTNPLFDRVRTLPPGSVESYPGIWEGRVSGQPSTDPQGSPIPDTWFFDLPDGPPRNPNSGDPVEASMYFPGDRLWVIVSATDTNNNTTDWLVADFDPPQDGGLCGGGSKVGLRRAGSGGNDRPEDDPPGKDDPALPIPKDGLPGIWDVLGRGVMPYVQPRILVWNDAPDLSEYTALEFAMGQIGVIPGRDYDVYATARAEGGGSNGLGAGAGRGPSAAQLADYDLIIHLAGSSGPPLLSDGSGVSGNDKGDDVGLLELWRQQAADRHVFTFADRVASAMMTQGVATRIYLSDPMGVAFVDDDVSDVAGVVSVLVIPTANTPAFSTPFSVWGGCDQRSRSDQILPVLGGAAVTGHLFDPSANGGISGASASVVNDRDEFVGGTLYRRLDVTFPFAFARIRDVPQSGTSPSARANLLRELLIFAGFRVTGDGAVDAPISAEARLFPARPNPFNPRTTIDFASEQPRVVTARVLDTRGRVLRILHHGIVTPGVTTWSWNGEDAQGHRVASGTYFVQVRGDGVHATQKIALVE